VQDVHLEGIEMLDLRQSVGTLVLDHAACAPVLKRHRIDFFCRGDESIESASLRMGVDRHSLAAELASAIADEESATGPDPRDLPTEALIDLIVDRHHACLRETLPIVQELAAKVARLHGRHHPRLCVLEALVSVLHSTLVRHLDAEEQFLFPAMIEACTDRASALPDLAAAHEDHSFVSVLLERIRTESNDFDLPRWACSNHRSLMSELAAIECDLITHVHLENQVLLPRFRSPSAGPTDYEA
jgi:regulator of cell morphogenesis and NO signaling